MRSLMLRSFALPRTPLLAAARRGLPVVFRRPAAPSPLLLSISRRHASSGSGMGLPSGKNFSVAMWFYLSSAVVAGTVVVGGMTRLTESGLSIVEWRPVTGVVPPMSAEEWEGEFSKYRNFPEYKQKPNMTLDEFKSIYYWEWGHRVLARSIGVIYGVPLLYFLARGHFRGHPVMAASAVGILGLGGAQGAMGWFMVKSGLDHKLTEEGKKATVCSYRLAAHLTLAFIIYASMMRIGLGLRNPAIGVFRGKAGFQTTARLSFATMFGTAVSGAFVAGLDAGLLYSDGFPLMGGRVMPPWDELTALNPQWANLFENGVAAQTWHRMMAGTTTLVVLIMNGQASRVGSVLPGAARHALWAVNAALLLQVSLGIATLVSNVHTHTAASHQAGSMVLLTTLIRLCAVLGSRGVILG